MGQVRGGSWGERWDAWEIVSDGVGGIIFSLKKMLVGLSFSGYLGTFHGTKFQSVRGRTYRFEKGNFFSRFRLNRVDPRRFQGTVHGRIDRTLSSRRVSSV